MLALSTERKRLMKAYPNLVDTESKLLFRHFYDQRPMPEDGAKKMDVEVRRTLTNVRRIPIEGKFKRSSAEAWKKRGAHPHRHPQGAERLVDRAVLAHLFETLGIAKQHVVFSDYTSEEMWMEGGKYGSIDPCYPSKVGQAHIHNLLFHHHTDERKLNLIFFPTLTHVPSFVEKAMD